MTRRFTRFLVLGALLGCGLVACGDDDDDGPTDSGTADTGRPDAGPTDMGMPPEDMGMPEDMGPPEEDMGMPDAGPPPAAINVRVAHLAPNGPAVKVCMSVRPAGTDMFIDLPNPITEALAPDGIPYRGISNYNPAIFEGGRDYRLRLYAAAALMGSPAMCPASGEGDGSLFTFELTARDDGSGVLNTGNYYTLAATGLAPDPATGELPMVCGAMLNGACTEGTDRTMGQVGLDVQLFQDDDPADVSADGPTIQVANASPNSPPITVCFDPDGPGAMEPTPLGISAVLFGTRSDPIVVTGDLTAGTLAIFPFIPGADPDPTDCQTVVPTGPSYVPLPVPIPAALEGMAERLDCTFRADQRYTIITAGIADTDMMPEPTDSTVLPWRDSGGDMDTMAEDGCPAM